MLLEAEMRRARAKHPSSRFLLPALMEEVGELARAMMVAEERHLVAEEALQVACVACRIAEEGLGIFELMTPEEMIP